MIHSQEIALRCAMALMRKSPGRPFSSRAHWGVRMGVTKAVWHKWSSLMLDQLCRCYDDSARRLLVRGIR